MLLFFKCFYSLNIHSFNGCLPITVFLDSTLMITILSYQLSLFKQYFELNFGPTEFQDKFEVLHISVQLLYFFLHIFCEQGNSYIRVEQLPKLKVSIATIPLSNLQVLFRCCQSCKRQRTYDHVLVYSSPLEILWGFVFHFDIS